MAICQHYSYRFGPNCPDQDVTSVAYAIAYPCKDCNRCNSPQRFLGLFNVVRAGAVLRNGKFLERPIDITSAKSGGPSETEVALNHFIDVQGYILSWWWVISS